MIPPLPSRTDADGNVMPSARRRVLDGRIRVIHFEVPVGRARLLGVVALAALVAVGATAYASFTARVTPTHASSTASMTLTLGATGSVTNRFNIDATAIAAGDTIQRTLDLIIGGTSATKEVDLAVQTAGSPLRNPDGLRIVIDQCVDNVWVESGTNPAFTYTCADAGGATVRRSDISIDALTWLFTQPLITGNPSGTQHLRVTFTMPVGASTPNTELATFGNASVTPTFTFTGVQRNGTDK